MGSYVSLRDQLIGEELGGCKILSAIGGGGMGYVFKAYHKALDKNVALKVLTPALRESRELRERFAREARIAGAVEHPNVVAIYSVGEEKGNSYIIMRYIEGASLYRVLSRQGMEPMPVARIGQHIASALAAVHAAGFVHRDIKPENIVMSEKGPAFLTDFGVAAGMGSAEPPGKGGSPAYMSPEQCKGKPLDGRSDLYSLGVTLYQMLTGRRPFLATTAPGLMLMHQQDDYPPIQSLRSEAPPELVYAIDRLLAKDPNKRPANAQELADTLADIQEDLRSRRRRDTMTVKKRETDATTSPTGESGFFNLVHENDPEQQSEIAAQAEEIELGLLSAELGDEAAVSESFLSVGGSSATEDAAIADKDAAAARDLLARDKFDKALTRINSAIDKRTNDAALYLTRAAVKRKRKEFDAAEADYRKALELAPDDRRALTGLGALLRTTGKLKEAEDLLKRAIELEPANVEARIAIGKIYEVAGALGLAQKQYKKAVEHAPADERAYVALAAVLISQGKHAAAKGLLGSARELNPTFAPTLYWLAVVLAKGGSYEDAVDMLCQAVKSGFKDRKRLLACKEFEPMYSNPRFALLAEMFA